MIVVVYVCDMDMSLPLSNEDDEPIDEQIKQEDGVYGDDVLLLLDYHIHKRNRPYFDPNLPKVDQTNAAAAISNFSRKSVMPIFFKKKTTTAASTMGKMQYPSTHTHWKKEIFPPSNLVFTVTTNDPPHIIRKTMPNSLPFELIPMLRILRSKTSTGKGGGRGEVGPRDPLSL